jgi:hypothetical protein
MLSIREPSKDIYPRVSGIFFKHQKDWEVRLRVVGDVFFQSYQKSRIEILFSELLEMRRHQK